MKSHEPNSESPAEASADTPALQGGGVPVEKREAFQHIRFAISAVYRDFETRWGWLPQPHDFWVNHWSGELTEFPIAAIRAAAREAVLWQTSSPPSLSEFKGIYRQVLPEVVGVEGDQRETRKQMIERFLRESLSENAPLSSMDAVRAHLTAAALIIARDNLAEDIPWDTKTMQTDFFRLAAEVGTQSVEEVEKALDGQGSDFASYLFLSLDGSEDDE